MSKMQSFWFFVSTKELGVRGLAPENNNNIKTNFDKLKNF